MAHMTSRSRPTPTEPESFLDCLRYFLTPQVCKQVQRAARPHHGWRWQPQALLYVLLVMTWCWGESLPERFETARAFYVASYQKRRRPGKTYAGFQKACAQLPTRVLRVVAAAVRGRLTQVFAERFRVGGFVPLGCDGSRLECPRSQELEERTPVGSVEDSAPMLWVTAVVHLSLGLLWSWRLGKGTASERDHLRHLIATLPATALLVMDAGYVSYDLLTTLETAGVAFLIRLSSKAPLYAPERVAVSRYRDGQVYYWPQEVQQNEQPPLPIRLLRLRGRKVDVWLATNVLDPERLPRPMASKLYRWRWRNEGLFRTYKRTLGKVKLMSRTLALAHREAEGSLLAVQLLLAQGALAVQWRGEAQVVLPSARQVLLEIRADIRTVTGMYLGPRQRRSYLERLKTARSDRRHRRSPKVRRQWPVRKNHKPPKPPKILKMGTDLKKLLEKTLGIQEAGKK
jgi:Transposase DDE domain